MEYKRLLKKLIKEMHDSVIYWLSASYKANEPEIAMDATPAIQLQQAIKKLSRRWQRRFNKAAPILADYFSLDVSKRSDAQLKKILKDAGFTVKFTMTKAQKDVLQATVNQNVSLIKSIPQKYFTDVEGLVMRSVTAGRDLSIVAKGLEKTYGVTKRRAAHIALDQNNKATASLTRARQIEVGITEAVWMHSGGGKHPRPTHMAAGKRKQKYDVAKGWYDPHESKYIFPGELVNCRCVSLPVIEGFS